MNNPNYTECEHQEIGLQLRWRKATWREKLSEIKTIFQAAWHDLKRIPSYQISSFVEVSISEASFVQKQFRSPSLSMEDCCAKPMEYEIDEKTNTCNTTISCKCSK